MSFVIDVKFEGTRTIRRNAPAVFKKMQEITPLFKENFPGIDQFYENKDGVYIWKFREFGFGGKKIGLELQTRFTINPDLSISTQSIPDSLHHITAHWKLVEKKGETDLSFSALLNFQIPLPILMRGMIAPLAEREIIKLFNQFLENVDAYLS